MSRDVLTVIVAQARVNNPLDGITGILVFDGTRFVQVLEGSEEAISDMLLRLECDDRHTDMKVCALEQIKERAFPDWSMGFLDLAEDAEGIDGLKRALGRPVSPTARALLESLVRDPA